jgi:hypothetical protein
VPVLFEEIFLLDKKIIDVPDRSLIFLDNSPLFTVSFLA